LLVCECVELSASWTFAIEFERFASIIIVFDLALGKYPKSKTCPHKFLLQLARQVGGKFFIIFPEGP